MPINYTVRQKAQEDLISIWLYTAEQWGVEQAGRYLQQIEDKFIWLAENPKAGQLRSDLPPACYCMPCNSHLVFYDLGDDQIDIIRVMHQRADLDNWSNH